ncbi:MAG: cyclic nucleotide-binding domain-containing protein [Thaumarchaeota archaeon]|nr:cyclic nucleotide-binding domain-containing protein [Nitrososphaerota archaeon]
MSDKYVAEMLRSVPLFSGLKPKHIKTIIDSGRQTSYDAGKHIVKEGEDGVGFYLILDGEVEVRRRGKLLSKLGKGDFFGEMSLIDKQPRSADVIAMTPVTCFGLTSWIFSGIVRTEPDIAMNLMRELVRRLRGTNKVLTE